MFKEPVNADSKALRKRSGPIVIIEALNRSQRYLDVFFIAPCEHREITSASCKRLTESAFRSVGTW